MTLSEYANSICQRLLKLDVELDKQIFELKMINGAIYEDLRDSGNEEYINRLQKCIEKLESIKDNV